jgi:hypothetical protein
LADKHPYTPSPGGVIQTVAQLRRSFPAVVTADTLKKLSIAPNNETYIINVLRFIGAIDDEGKKTDRASSTFAQHEDGAFQKSFSELVEAAYSDLFQLHGTDTWSLPSDRLISFFRGSDHTSAIVGQRQSSTFQTLASLGGHREAPANKAAAVRPTSARQERPLKKEKRHENPLAADAAPPKDPNIGSFVPYNVGLGVRIEINLPVADDQAVYDRIFKSIRENLIAGR